MQRVHGRKQSKVQRSNSHDWQRKPYLEQLERRELFAIYLPDSFANQNSQPVGTAFNSGEQMFFGGHSGGLQFEFGNSAAANTYAGPGWNRRDVDSLITGSLPDLAGNPSLYEARSSGSSPEQLHAVYRSDGGAILDVWASPWQSRELVASGAVSDPTAATLNGGRQVLYVGSDGHVHFVASGDSGANWGNTDLNALVGLASDPGAIAVATSGIAALQVGSFEYYVYHRADGQFGYFLWNGTAWGYDALDASDLGGYIAPTSGARGAMEGISYSTTGSATPNVGWVLYRDATGSLRGVWLAGGGPWRTAALSTVQMMGAPAAAYDPTTAKLNVAFVDNNAHLRVAREGSPWTTIDFHASSTISMPLSTTGVPDSTGGATQARGTVDLVNTGGTITLAAVAGGAADASVGNATALVFGTNTAAVQAAGALSFAMSGGAINVSAVAGSAADGTAGNSVNFVVGSSAAVTSAAYNSLTNTVTVNVNDGGTATIGDVSAAIDGLAEFHSSVAANGAAIYSPIDDGTFATPLTGGANASVSATYDAATNTLAINVGAGATIAQIAAAIDALADFNVSSYVNGTARFDIADYGVVAGALAGGSTVIVAGAAVKPDIYFREFATSSGGPGMHVLYKDQSNHVYNVRLAANSALAFDTTAYMEGYHPRYGYGIVNAAAAVGYALNSSSAVAGPGSGAWNLSLVRAPSVWTHATGQNTAVFVLDSGIDTTNADLVLLTGYNVAGNNTNIADTNGHGTGVAGIIAGVNDGLGVTGVAYNSRVVPVKIGDAGPASEKEIVDGINYATNYTLPAGYSANTRVVNMSFASTGSSMASVRNTMYVKSPNTVFVTAAGNRTQDTPDTPAIYNVGFGIVAGAINSASQLWAPTNGTGGAATPYNFLLAPGVGVTSDTLVGTSGNTHNTATVNGTSAAAAHISGVVALMLEANPNLTAREVESILIASAEQAVTQTMSAGAPSIPGVIYWAGGDEQALSHAASATLAVAAPAASIAEIPSDRDAAATGVAHSGPATLAVEMVPASFELQDRALLAATDDVFSGDAEEDSADLFDLLAEVHLQQAAA
jgi:subtilisin